MRSHWLGRRDALEVVQMIDRHAIGKTVVSDCPATGLDSLIIDVGEAQALVQAVRADEAGARAPFEHARLSRHPE